VTISSMTERFQNLGDESPQPMPWILCGPFLPPESTGESAGSTATVRNAGLRALITWEMPVMVPPVPTPADQDVGFSLGVLPDFLGRGFAVHPRVGRVGELVGHVGFFLFGR